MFDASLDDRARHRLFRFPAVSIVIVPTVGLRQHQPAQICLQPFSADQQSQQ